MRAYFRQLLRNRTAARSTLAGAILLSGVGITLFLTEARAQEEEPAAGESPPGEGSPPADPPKDDDFGTDPPKDDDFGTDPPKDDDFRDGPAER